MQVDSANQEELVKNLQTANATAEQTISNQLAAVSRGSAGDCEV